MRFSIWDIVFLAGFVVYVVIRGKFIERCKKNEKVVREFSVWERILLPVVAIGTMLLPVLHVFTPLLRFAEYTLPPFVPWCGTVVMILALWLFWRSHADLGNNWSVTLEVRRGHELVTRGVYRYIRHPMYAAIFLFSIAQGLLLDDWLAGWSALVTFGLLYVVRARREERMMCEHFGDQYRDYMARTGRLLPRLRAATVEPRAEA